MIWMGIVLKRERKYQPMFASCMSTCVCLKRYLLIATLFKPKLDTALHIPLLAVSPKALRDKHLLNNSDKDVAADLDLVLLIADPGRRDDVDMAVSAEQVGVGRLGVCVILGGRGAGRIRRCLAGE